MLDELNNRIADVVHNISDAERREREAEKNIRDADDDMDSARGRRDAAEQEKRAALEEQQRQLGRFVELLQEALHELRPLPPPRPPEFDRREPDRRFHRPMHRYQIQ
jgi:chromosome segregation ATPase